MKRTAILRRPPAAATLTVPVYKPKRCRSCKSTFTPAKRLQAVCGPLCAAAHAAAARQKAEAKTAAADRRETKEKLEAMKTIPQLKKEAQREFNRFVRHRDRLAGHPCISSAKPLNWGTTGITGSSVDAGHFRSTGAADHLRFDEDNCHAQSVHENRDRAGNAVAYRIGLIARIGLARVEALENNNTPVKWTRDGLRAIRDGYRAKANLLEKQIAMQG